MPKEEIEELIAKAKKSFKCFIGPGSDVELEVVVIPTGIPVFDRIIEGGFRRKATHLISGEFSTGKTFLVYQTIKQAQERDYRCVLIDAERRFDPKWAKKIGIDIDNLIVINPDYGEQAFELLNFFLKDEVDLIAIDSFAALLPSQEAETDEMKPTMGLHARMMSQGLRKVANVNKNSVVIATNQLRSQIGTMYHPGIFDTMTGGKAQYYYASSIIQVRRRGFLVEKEGKVVEAEGAEKKRTSPLRKVGFVMECLVSKLNYGADQRLCEIPINFVAGEVDNISSIIDLAIDLDVITQAGPWYNYADQKFQGKLSVRDWFNEDETRLEKLKKEILI